MSRADSTGRRRGRLVMSLALSGMVVMSAGCGSDGEEDASEKALATQFVDSLNAAGIAPRMTVDAAEALYDTDAAPVCEAFDGTLSTSARNVLLGNLAQKRKAITDDAVTYGRLVVQTYCPDQLDDFDQAVRDVDPIEKSDS